MTTTIEIRDGAKDALDDLKDHEKEPYKDVVTRLIAAYESDTTDAMDSHSNGPDTDDLATDISAAVVQDLRGTLPTAVVDELEGRR